VGIVGRGWEWDDDGSVVKVAGGTTSDNINALGMRFRQGAIGSTHRSHRLRGGGGGDCHTRHIDVYERSGRAPPIRDIVALIASPAGARYVNENYELRYYLVGV
jgi:hypothetical protein